MTTSNLFEQMLATYPAERRELAREVYHRFADGDTTQFFTQLFFILDVYAQFSHQIPNALIDAADRTQATAKRLGEEIGVLAQTIDARSVNIGNHAAKTNDLCRITQVKCDETIQRVEQLADGIASRIDIDSVIEEVQATWGAKLQAEIIGPFVERSQDLTNQVLPTLKQIREAAAEAAEVWPKRIWWTVLAAGLTIGLAAATAATSFAYWAFHKKCETQVADRIMIAEQVINYNREAFRELAIAHIPIKVVRMEHHAMTNTPGLALIVADAENVELRRNDGHRDAYIFFSTTLAQEELQALRRAIEQVSNR